MTSPPRPLRVALLTVSLDVGGVERKLLMLAECLPRDRYEIEFVLLGTAGPLAEDARAMGIPVHVLGWPSKRARLHQIRWLWHALWLGPQLRRGRYDVLHGLMFHAYVLGALTRPITRIRVLVAGRDRMDDYKRSFGPARKLADVLARRSADAIVAVSKAVRTDVAGVEHLDQARIRVIRNGADAPPAMAAMKRSSIRAGWGFGPEDLVIGSVANYRPDKGLDTLIRAFAKVRASHPRTGLVLVGEGPLRSELDSEIARLGLGGSVRLHGWEPDARGLYEAFDIYAHAARSEGGPSAVIEASAAARPIVATRAGGTVEAVVDGETGLLVPVDDEDALSTAIERLIEDPALRQRLAAGARARALAEYSVDRYVTETAALWDELAAAKGVRA